MYKKIYLQREGKIIFIVTKHSSAERGPYAAFLDKSLESYILRTIYPSLKLSQRIFVLFLFLIAKILVNPSLFYGAVPKSLRPSKPVISDLPAY